MVIVMMESVNVISIIMVKNVNVMLVWMNVLIMGNV